MIKKVLCIKLMLLLCLPVFVRAAMISDFSTVLTDNSTTWVRGPDNTTAEITVEEFSDDQFTFEFIGTGHSYAQEAPFTDDWDRLDATYELSFTIDALAAETWDLYLTTSTLLVANIFHYVSASDGGQGALGPPTAVHDGDIAVSGDLLPVQGAIYANPRGESVINRRELESTAIISGLGSQIFTLTYSISGDTYSYDAVNRQGDYAYIEFGHNIVGDLTSSEAAPAPVPEPATLFLFGTGLVGFAGFGRKRFKK